MAEPPKTRPQGGPAAPPRLERAAPPGGGPRAPSSRPAPVVAPGASYGLDAPEVTADAAVAAGLAHQGALAEDSGLRLFALAAATQATGRLTLSPDGRTYALSFRKGTLEHAASSAPEDDLARYLQARGVVSAEQVARAEGSAAAMGGIGAALVTLQLVPPGDLVRHVQEHATQLVARALAAEAGSWRWEPGVAPPPGSFRLGSPWALLCAAVRALDGAAVVRRLGGRDQLGATRIAGRVRAEELRLTPQETHAAARLDGHKLADVARAHPAEAATILRVALLLAEVGLVTFGPPREGSLPAPPPRTTPVATPVATPPSAPPAAPQPSTARPAPTAATPAAAPKPAVARPAAPAPAASRPATTPPPGTVAAVAPNLAPAVLKALLASYLAEGADHYTVLGVKRDAPAAQVKTAYFQLAKAYHPDTVATGAPPEVKKLCADVFARIGEAWSILGDEAKRTRYLEDLKSGAGVDVDVMNILKAEGVFEAGTLLVKARRYDEAVARFDEALALNPDEAEFGMWRAWCEFLLAQDKKRIHAAVAGTIEAGLKKNPRCAQGYLFLGQMAKLLGDLAQAERHLKRGLVVAPEHTDLVRELKYLRK